MNRDEIEGKKENLEGRVKQATGALLDDRELEKKGSDKRVEGEVREEFGRARRKIGETIEELGDEIKR